ncbi:RES domain-containing protein [Streptomyces achromogenes]|uniref:RES domain-containing protein n=1 Tax=Streptomyces achromogenes TaxID=67255 RepID=UPI0036B551E8
MSRDGGRPAPLAVCLRHVRDPHLRRRVEAGSVQAPCRICAAGPERRCASVPLEELVAQVRRAAGRVYREVHPPDPNGRHPDGSVGSAEVLSTLCPDALDEGARAAVAHALEPVRWAPHAPGASPGQGGVCEPWPSFTERVKHRRRFTLLAAQSPGRHPWSPRDDTPSTLGMLDGICAALVPLGLIRTLPTGVRIWRGRMRRDASRPGYTAATIGAAPASRAKANRMSAAGLSMFYGSADPDVAVAEISAHDPRPFAAVAAFEPARPLSVIDLTALPEPPSLFDPRWSGLFLPVTFIRAFAQDLSRPVVLDGREHLDYVPTQVVTEYFRWAAPLRVDGILFRSARDGGLNYGLFTGPEGCADAGEERPGAMLRFVPGSEVVLRRRDGPRSPDGPKSGESAARAD